MEFDWLLNKIILNLPSISIYWFALGWPLHLRLVKVIPINYIDRWILFSAKELFIKLSHPVTVLAVFAMSNGLLNRLHIKIQKVTKRIMSTRMDHSFEWINSCERQYLIAKTNTLCCDICRKSIGFTLLKHLVQISCLGSSPEIKK
jgi:hypothetical protein